MLGRDWERYRKLRHPAARTRFAASRLVLKHAVAAVARVRPQEVELGRTAAGRPYLHGGGTVHISLSHTENLLLVGLSTSGAVGVDAEAHDRPLYGPGLGRHMCTPHELAEVEALPQQERNPRLLRLWTLKEACSKALGVGLAARFTDFGFSTDEHGRPTLHGRPSRPRPRLRARNRRLGLPHLHRRQPLRRRRRPARLPPRTTRTEARRSTLTGGPAGRRTPTIYDLRRATVSMNHLEELKEFARLHARGQGMRPAHVADVLETITCDTPDDARSWARVWTAQGDVAARRGDLLDACRHYALARFPHHSDEDRRSAQQRCVSTFDEWRREAAGVQRLEFDHPDGKIACWASGLDEKRRRPLLLVMGGIVSVKEQWAPLLPKLRRMGFAAVVTELPGVGENTCAYHPESWRLLPHLLDRLSGSAGTDDASLLALSFSGHLALRAATEDHRIRRVLTVGAPVAEFFTDPQWWPRVPRITVDTLRALTGVGGETELRALLGKFALGPEQLSDLRIPVRYVLSSRDEIIPGADAELLRRHAPGDVRFKTFDDVHGSPAHLAATRRWLLSSLLRLKFTARKGS